MSSYQVSIVLNQSTINALSNGGFRLYGFPALQCSDKAGAPVVWFSSNSFAPTMNVSFTDAYSVFTSPAFVISAGQRVQPGFTAPIAMGDILTVNAVGGSGPVTTNGDPNAITVLNQTATQYCCGLSQNSGSGMLPSCVFPLYGEGIELLAPLPKLLLLFSNVPAATGTVIEVSYGPGILIDFSNNNSVSVQFDINSGWSWGAYSWAAAVPANANLVPLLIEYSYSLAEASGKVRAAGRSGLPASEALAGTDRPRHVDTSDLAALSNFAAADNALYEGSSGADETEARPASEIPELVAAGSPGKTPRHKPAKKPPEN